MDKDRWQSAAFLKLTSLSGEKGSEADFWEHQKNERGSEFRKEVREVAEGRERRGMLEI